MPHLGDIVRGRDIGKSGDDGSRRYTWVACENCGIARWVQLRSGKPRSRLCRLCNLKSDERRHNVSVKMKEKYTNPEYKAHITETIKARWRIPKFRQKMSVVLSKALRGRVVSEDARLNNGMAQKRRFERPEERQKVSDCQKKLWQNPAHREMMCRARKGRVISEEQRRKVSLSMKEFCKSPEVKRRRSEIAHEFWENAENKARVIRAWIKGCNNRPTRLEMKVLEAIKKYGLPYVYNGNSAGRIIAGKCPDFINNNGLKAVIEVYGDYWHQGEDENIRRGLFATYGFRTLILWESHINERSVDELATEIKEFTNR